MNGLQSFPCDWAEPRDQALIARAVKTLYGNIIEKPKEGADFVFGSCRGIVPSLSTYKGVWNWDAAFHMIAMAYLDKELAHDQARIMFRFQKPDGQLPDVVYTSGKTVFKFTKPPVFAFAVMCADKIAPDDAFLTDSYPFLKANLKWWETARFDGTLFSYKVSSMESGWDNTPRFDYPHKTERCYAVDCNCFMADFYRAMAYIAERLSRSGDIPEYIRKREVLTKNINTILCSSGGGYYCDYNFRLKKLTGRLSPASFMPLFTGIADKEQAEAMKRLAADPAYFYKGIPTISYNSEKYDSAKYWRGPCWINQAYFVIRGLWDYGYESLASELTEQILGWCSQNDDSIYEYYDSRTGKGLGAKGFGWSSVFVIELILLKYKKNRW